MWLWQHLSGHKRHAFFLKFAVGVALAHLLLLYLLFFSYNHGSRDVMLIVRQAQAGEPVKFVALSGRGSDRRGGKKANAQRGTQKKGARVAAKQPAKKSPQKTKAATSLKSAAVKKEAPKAKPAQKKKPAAKPVKEKVLEKKEEPKEKPKVIEKKVAPEEKVPEKTPEQTAEPEANNLADKVTPEQENVQEELVVSFGSWGTIEQEEVAELYKELSENWRPPAGIAEDCECTMKLHVGWDQTLIELETIKTSGVLMYDVSVRSALQKIVLPLWTRGKNLTITFRQ